MTESKKRQTIDEGWKQATEDINACDTTAYTEAYDLRVTCIPQQKPKKLCQYTQVSVALRNGRLVVLKRFNYKTSDELKFLCMCQHPYINTILDVYTGSKSSYLVLEYHELGDWLTYLRKQKK